MHGMAQAARPFLLAAVTGLAACAPTPGKVALPAPAQSTARTGAEAGSAAQGAGSGTAAESGPAGGSAASVVITVPARRLDGADAARADTLSRSILEQVNQARRREGRQVLLPDERLERAAQSYARELADRGGLDHESPAVGRRTLLDRLSAEGVHSRQAAENLAVLTATPEALPVDVVKLWLDSPGHRANLLEPLYSATGIGVSPGSNGVWYVTQEYSSRP